MLSRSIVFHIGLAALVTVGVLRSPISGAPPTADTDSKKPVDEQLLDDDPATSKPAPKSANEPPKTLPADHPLARVAGEMHDTQRLLAQRRSDALTQRKQQQIADALAALLKHAQQSQQQKSKPGAQKQPEGKPDPKKPGGQTGGAGATNPKANESIERHGEAATTSRPDIAELRSTLKHRWGHLPPNVYEEVIQAARGRFLTQYELDIEKYFQRLLEQRDSPKR